MKLKLAYALSIIAPISLAQPSYAALIDFTGGTVYQFGGNTATTNTVKNYVNVDYYEEDGVRFDFVGPPGNPVYYVGANNIGNYYNAGNDVIHGHWEEGPYGFLESIVVNKIDGSSFDLNYFKITTNTANGGSAASGNEEVYINALADGVNISYSQLLPPDDWGFAGPNSAIPLGPEFDDILAFSFTRGANAVGFGLDEFFIDEEPPELLTVPEPTSTAMLFLVLAGMGFAYRKQPAQVEASWIASSKLDV